MSKILLGISVLFLLGSSYLSFANKQKLATKTETLHTTTASLNAARVDVADKAKKIKVGEEALKTANDKANDLQSQVTAKENQVAQLNDKIGEVNKAVTDKDTEIARLNKAMQEVLGKNPIGPDGGVATIEQKLKDLAAQLDEQKALRESLQGQLKGAQDQLDQARKINQQHIAGTTKPGLRGRIDAVDRNWNFVVLSLGDRDGVNNGTQMLVVRGGNIVGKVKISSVEPTQSIGDIVPNSVPPGIAVQPGDTVVYPN